MAYVTTLYVAERREPAVVSLLHRVATTPALGEECCLNLAFSGTLLWHPFCSINVIVSRDFGSYSSNQVTECQACGNA